MISLILENDRDEEASNNNNLRTSPGEAKKERNVPIWPTDDAT